MPDPLAVEGKQKNKTPIFFTFLIIKTMDKLWPTDIDG